MSKLGDIEIGDEYDGFRVYAVGGAVRDSVMGRQVEDVDLLAIPRGVDGPVKILKERMVFVDPDSTIPVFLDSRGREVALPRTEKSTGEGHKDFEVDVLTGEDPEELLLKDLKRRDFTINAMAYDTEERRIVDPHGGRRDIERGIIRHVSRAFAEDPLRVLRMARFAARFDFGVAPETLEFAKELASRIPALPGERLRLELEKAMKQAKSPRRFFDVLEKVNALGKTFPEIREMTKIPAGPPEHHGEGSAYEHTMRVVQEMNRLRPNDYYGLLAALVHDLGKMMTPSEKLPHHYRHTVRGLGAVKMLAERLAMSNREVKVMKEAVRHHHRVPKVPEMSAGTLLDLVTGVENLEVLIDLWEADRKGRKPGKELDKGVVEQLIETVEAVVEEVDGETVLQKHGYGKDSVGTEISGKDFGNLIRQHRVERVRERISFS